MRSLRGALTVLFIAHAVLVIGTQMPKDSVLRASFERIGASYMKATGNWQGWDMFDSAPNYHAYRVELMAKMPDGEIVGFPPVLPGLREQDDYVRSSTYFLRAIDGAYALYFHAYARNACNEVEARTGKRPQSVFMRQHVERIRAIHDVRADGVVSTRQIIDGKPGTCGAP